MRDLLVTVRSMDKKPYDNKIEDQNFVKMLKICNR